MPRRKRPWRRGLAAAGAAVVLGVLGARAGHATFHLMQIEQVIGGVCGDTSAQAIQLRMRTGSQNFVDPARLVAWDSAGANPITLLEFPDDAPNGGAGVRILVATAAFVALGGPPPDFTLTNPIPSSYLAAGKLTFQQASTVYWGLAWGGAAYTGTNSGAFDNDGDGNFGVFGQALPSTGVAALRFTGTAAAPSTSNAADYALTAGAATWTNNAGASAVVDCTLFGDGFESGTTSAWDEAEP